MKAITFPQANTTLKGNGESVKDMVVYTDGVTCVSVWELSEEEIQDIIRNRKIYLTILHPPNNFPPVGLTTIPTYPIFPPFPKK